MAKEEITKRVGDLLGQYLEDKDLEIWQVEYRKTGKEWMLRVILDKPADSEEEYVGIEDCEMVTRWLSDRLDEEDWIDRSYTLEVSSPGLDRELIHDADYERFAGRVVEVKLYEPLNGRKSFEAVLQGKQDGVVSLELEDGIAEIPEKKIAKINLAVIF